MDPMAVLVARAEEAGRAGQSWARWTASDETQDLINACERPDVDAVEAAFAKGAREHRITGGWRVFWTIAPADYDGFGTETVEACGTYCDKPLRRVIIDPDYVSWQTGRYWSGMHPSWEEDPRIAEAKAKAARAEADRLSAEREARHTVGLAWMASATDDELEDFDTFEAHGLRFAEVKAERERRVKARASKACAEEWAACVAVVPEGVTLVDNGTPGERGVYGWIPGIPTHVYHNVRIVKGWPDNADNANVIGEGGDNAGSLAYVADWLKSGRMRIATEADVIPPRAVVQRIGAERWKEIRRVDVDGRTVWVGRAMFSASLMVLDDKGHLVRAKKILAAAIASIE